MSHPVVLYVEDDANDVLFMRHAWTKAGVLDMLLSDARCLLKAFEAIDARAEDLETRTQKLLSASRLTLRQSQALLDHSQALLRSSRSASCCASRAAPVTILRATPATEAGKADHVWHPQEVAGLVD